MTKNQSFQNKNVEIVNLILNFAGAGAGPFLPAPAPAKITGSDRLRLQNTAHNHIYCKINRNSFVLL